MNSINNISIAKDHCLMQPCKNGGLCRVTRDGYECKCVGDYFGSLCQFHPSSSSPEKATNATNI